MYDISTKFFYIDIDVLMAMTLSSMTTMKIIVQDKGLGKGTCGGVESQKEAGHVQLFSDYFHHTTPL
jgi:hypothetical protein